MGGLITGSSSALASSSSAHADIASSHRRRLRVWLLVLAAPVAACRCANLKVHQPTVPSQLRSSARRRHTLQCTAAGNGVFMMAEDEKWSDSEPDSMRAIASALQLEEVAPQLAAPAATDMADVPQELPPIFSEEISALEALEESPYDLSTLERELLEPASRRHGRREPIVHGLVDVVIIGLG